MHLGIAGFTPTRLTGPEAGSPLSTRWTTYVDPSDGHSPPPPRPVRTILLLAELG
ncbi:hypothetical protein [Catellatospora sp. NPDC049609]|uniref:hypothetical protein n=1 Tax=Catellatospora sp. NPDC049609 TaxID=3155505 RepID=UPI00341AECD8